MTDTSGLNLREPEQMDWDQHDKGTSYMAPPPALDADGNPIIYQAQLPTDMASPARLAVNRNGFREFRCGPLKLAKNGPGVDGYEIRFFDVSVEKYKSRTTGEAIELSSASKLLRGAGIKAKPQKNAEWEQAIKLTAGKLVPVVIDWRAKNRDTGEEIRGYENFPLDPERPGRRKAILKAGDILPNGETVRSEVLFANAVVRYVVDPTRR